ncbi:MAG: hypothetical protein B6D56_06115 [Candidatus Omnitrophica bacterium 4484_70.1]|nr:MAG: hypothetical protein B6D56_06115 [Candidatus Omnitrophica bacterium 4484_70.1]
MFSGQFIISLFLSILPQYFLYLKKFLFIYHCLVPALVEFATPADFSNIDRIGKHSYHCLLGEECIAMFFTSP